MTPFMTELEDQLRAAAEREARSAQRRGTRMRRAFGSTIRIAPAVTGAALALLVLVAAVVLVHHDRSLVQSEAPPSAVGPLLRVGSPVGPAHPLNGGRIEPGTAKVVAEARDPHGGLPWALESFRMTGGQTCVLVGREQSGHLGLIGQDGSFGNDGRFHPFTVNTLSQYCGQTDGNGNTFIDVGVPAIPASGNDQGVASGGCQPAGLAAREAHAQVCPAADERQLEYGLLGPFAKSVTYSIGGHTTTVPTGPAGAYLVVGSPIAGGSGGSVWSQLTPGLVTAVHYRNGSTCRPTRTQDGQSRNCPPVGYVAPATARVTTAEVRTPVHATVITAKRWCSNPAGHAVACDDKIPAGYSVIPGTGPDWKLIQWSWIAHVTASGPNSGYEYTLTGGPPCGGGESSSAPIHAQRGQRIVEQSLGSTACAQKDTISIEYRTNVGPGGTNFASPPKPGHDGQPFVGSTTITVPR